MSARLSVNRGVRLRLDTLVTAAQRGGPCRQVSYLAERLGESRLVDSVALGLLRAPRGRR